MTVVTAEGLYAAYKTDKVTAADVKYKGETPVLRGAVTTIAIEVATP